MVPDNGKAAKAGIAPLTRCDRDATLPAEPVTYYARPGQTAYGFSIGIMCLEFNLPFIPGDVGNASTYDFPVMYAKVPGATGDAVIIRQDVSLTDDVIATARSLVAQGCKAVTSDCGYFGIYQRAVANALPVPVFLSSLLQIPLILSILGESQVLGVIVASEATLDHKLLEAVGVRNDERLEFRGLENEPHFREAIIEDAGLLTPTLLEREVVGVAKALRVEVRDLGAILLECSDLPPYGAAVQAATGVPVFDWISFIRFVHEAVVRTQYSGFY